LAQVPTITKGDTAAESGKQRLRPPHTDKFRRQFE
jgi:hypothetical protein